MRLDSNLKTAISRLRSDDLGNEEEVKLAVILPILHALDWDPAHSGSIKPEYAAGQGRVDFALLCHGRPQVFVEAKRRAPLDVRAEGQLFGYASNQGIPLLVLTDGYYWDFYLSMADGLPEQRRFYRLQLFHEDNIPEYMEFLETYLRKHRVASGEARRSAKLALREIASGESPQSDPVGLELPIERTRRVASRSAGREGAAHQRRQAGSR